MPTALTIEVREIDQDDRASYALGFCEGWRGGELQPACSYIPAYAAGYLHGERVKDGRDPLPPWARLA